ncbi:MAG: phospholipase D family protein [Erythrobacter sp.]|uniref:phospholipase D family protein n=1 Tax=Erythrobacter sp. TaxID=1042 RepID=UPI0032EC06DD
MRPRAAQKGEQGRVLGKLVIAASVVVTALLVLRWRYRLPARPAEEPRLAAKGPEGGALASLVGALDDEHGSAVQPLREGKKAFAARLMLIDKAERSIDVQCYIWHRDLTGVLTLERLRAAAERGVSVRLLLDDNGISGLDGILAELNAHPNIAVRLYNPFGLRWPRLANYLFDFLRLNRRMHNKAMTADRTLTITGGRNVGDEYFDTGNEPSFVDLDVIAAGEAARAVAADFARYWASRSAYRLERVIGSDRSHEGALGRALQAACDTEEYRSYAGTFESDPELRRIGHGALALEPAPTGLISDAPDKTLGSVLMGHLMVDELAEMLGEVERSLDLVSPYFVPGKRGTNEFVRLAARGVRVRVLTNSLPAYDVPLVHAGYRKYRRRLLEGGVELFEMKARASPPARRADAGALGSGGSSLHAKTFAADGERVFIGSFNFDPRSVWLNTEMGLVIESEGTAREIERVLAEEYTRIAYRVSLDSSGRMRWEDLETGEIHRHDPDSGLCVRIGMRAVGLLPIEWLL